MTDKKSSSAPTTLAHKLSDRLEFLLSECAIDGVELSKKTSIPVTTINRLRKEGSVSNPTLSTLIPIANFFDISLSQLIGDEPLPKERVSGTYKTLPERLHPIPVIKWTEIICWNQNPWKSSAIVTSENEYSEKSYALYVEEENLINLARGTILIVDPLLPIRNRDLVIVNFKDSTPALKQILFDEDVIYLKPLVNDYKIKIMTSEHEVFGVVGEYKKNLRK